MWKQIIDDKITLPRNSLRLFNEQGDLTSLQPFETDVPLRGESTDDISRTDQGLKRTPMCSLYSLWQTLLRVYKVNRAIQNCRAIAVKRALGENPKIRYFNDLLLKLKSLKGRPTDSEKQSYKKAYEQSFYTKHHTLPSNEGYYHIALNFRVFREFGKSAKFVHHEKFQI